MGQYSIKDVEVLSGIKAHTLRIWEKRYDFLKPERTDTNIRYYNDYQLRLILNISTLNRKGYKISRIAHMTEKELNAELLRSSDEADTDDQTDRLVRAMIDFEADAFEKVINQLTNKFGFEDTCIRLFFPFMMRTGVLWTAGTIRPAQEHFVTNLLRRKLLAAIDRVQTPVRDDAKCYVLFLPEGENHETLLLFTEYLLRLRSQHVVYLGSAVPLEDLVYVRDAFRPDVLVTYISIEQETISTQEYLRQLAEIYPDTRILAGGARLTQPDLHLAAHITVVNSVAALKEAIS
ncbi:MAG: MerR family transcriptional regulator [Bacteroidetes bacterium]|nr:MerR family transcriptional regulator [Bacteroidota bacterium]